jgi:hypothetical protein
MIGLAAIDMSIAGVTSPARDSPRNMSAPTSASASVSAGVSRSHSRFGSSAAMLAPRVQDPLRVAMITFSGRTPRLR